MADAAWAEPASTNGGKVPPRLAPNTSASDEAGVITPAVASDAISRTTVTLE